MAFEEFNSIVNDAINGRTYKPIQVKAHQPKPKAALKVVPVYWYTDSETGLLCSQPAKTLSEDIKEKTEQMRLLVDQIVIKRRSINDYTNQLVDVLINGVKA